MHAAAVGDLDVVIVKNVPDAAHHAEESVGDVRIAWANGPDVVAVLVRGTVARIAHTSVEDFGVAHVGQPKDVVATGAALAIAVLTGSPETR